MTVMNATPQLIDSQILEILAEHYQLSGELTELPSYSDLNRKLSTGDGVQYVVKVANINQNEEELRFENRIMGLLSQSEQLNIETPEVVSAKTNGESILSIKDSANQTCLFRVITFLEGTLWANARDTKDIQLCSSLGEALAKVDHLLAETNEPASYRYLQWDMRYSNSVVRKYCDCIVESDKASLISDILTSYETRVLPLYGELPCQLIHNDANDYNLLIDQDRQRVSGLFDFGDMVHSFRVAEIAIAAAYALMNKENIEELLKAIVTAYHRRNPLNQNELKVLFLMIQMRLAVSLSISSYQYTQTPENEYLLISQEGAWALLEKMASIDELSLTMQLCSLCSERDTPPNQLNNELMDYRRQHLSENLSLAYQQPLNIIAGRKAYLYDQTGNRYIDMVNNVCHVGHCHPDVVAAGQKQMAILNTNTRYLHQNIVDFSRQLLSTMPAELSVCMLVNSGSEANELAIRLARTHTQAKAMLVVDGAYHGNTNTCIDISPYKFDGNGGQGAPDWVKKTLCPDPFRGVYRGYSEATGKNYALDVKRAIDEFLTAGDPICGFICESIQGVGGQIIHPRGYLKAAYEHVRQAGGVCIADEVQVGMGRIGEHWWAFQSQQVVPDIVTIGKPLGNGHPLAAVVTTQAIADSFVTGMEYFNTFGGNPVSCAIGKAVFDVIEQEDLMCHALNTGGYLKEQLKALQQRFPVIGDVRGLGMFIGVEFINNPDTLEPAVQQIDYVIERLKSRGILLTTEGPLHNVLKIKPPLAFSQADAEEFILVLTEILQQPEARTTSGLIKDTQG